MRAFGNACGIVAIVAFIGSVSMTADAQTVGKYRPPVEGLEIYQDDPRPSGFGVQYTDLDGPVFVDPRGMTLYTWRYQNLQIGGVGDRAGRPSTCLDTKQTETTGFSTIYHGGLVLPDLGIRPTCVQAWPPMYAEADAKPVGKWTVLSREDGRKQWAYDGLPLYTSSLDTKPGQVFGEAGRRPVGPESAHPPAFKVRPIATGRVLMSQDGHVVYTWSGDASNKANCRGPCLRNFAPIEASQAALAQGEWGVIERSPSIKQWTLRGKPLYIHTSDKLRTTIYERGTALQGSDESGWNIAYMQKWPDPPKEFTVQEGRVGLVLADKNGMSLYMYHCIDDAPDSLSCDHPTETQTYRLMICGMGDPAACNKRFPYVPAPEGTKVNNMLWGTAWIDPNTGHPAQPRAPGAQHVWTFRDRPIFTHGGDKKPGDTNGDSWGEFQGYRNGYKAFWIRDDYMGAAN